MEKSGPDESSIPSKTVEGKEGARTVQPRLALTTNSELGPADPDTEILICIDALES